MNGEGDVVVGGRNLVICLDGTANEPEAGDTNVVRLFAALEKSAEQLTYYDPGVGTMGAPAALTRASKTATRMLGVALGSGIEDNIAQAYTWLAENYRRGDQLYLFGFSRGAYTARALAGMLRTVGLLRAGAQNLVPYALKFYSGFTGFERSSPESTERWKRVGLFHRRFGNPDFPNPFDTSLKQVRFLGVWDTVKTAGEWKWSSLRVHEWRWPFTRKHTNVEFARHAMAIDERRKPYDVYRFNPTVTRLSNGRHLERWFAGVHSDIGGCFPEDHRLSDIALDWMMKAAVSVGLKVNEKTYALERRGDESKWLNPMPDLPIIHQAGATWGALGFITRKIRPIDKWDESVDERIKKTNGAYQPKRTTDLKRAR